MKKKFSSCLFIFLLLFLVYFFVPGYFRNTSVFIENYSVSPDGNKITLDVGVSSSIGYIRDVYYKQMGNKLYLDFYSAFGGINGCFGAKRTFTIELNDNIDTISIYTNNDYRDVLIKNNDDSWQRNLK